MKPEPKKVNLPNGLHAIVDSEYFDFITSGNKWYVSRFGYAHKTEVVGGVKTHTAMHRLLMNPSKYEQIDHINGDRLDNRKCNLRVCTRQGNSANSKIRKDNKTGYKGVHKHNRPGKPFEASIMYEQKPIYISRFDTPEEAAMAYDNAALTLFGEFARINSEITV